MQLPSPILRSLMDSPAARLRLEYSYPDLRCARCLGPANGIYVITFTCDSIPSGWEEYFAGCASCFIGDSCKGVKCQRTDVPTRPILITDRLTREPKWIMVPEAVKREKIGLVLNVGSIYSAPPAIQQYLRFTTPKKEA